MDKKKKKPECSNYIFVVIQNNYKYLTFHWTSVRKKKKVLKLALHYVLSVEFPVEHSVDFSRCDISNFNKLCLTYRNTFNWTPLRSVSRWFYDELYLFSLRSIANSRTIFIVYFVVLYVMRSQSQRITSEIVHEGKHEKKKRQSKISFNKR